MRSVKEETATGLALYKWLGAFMALLCLTAGGGAARADASRSIGVAAAPAAQFLNSLGANSAISGRGENLQKTIDCTKYLGIRWFRSGIEGDIPIQDLITLHDQTGARFSWSPGSGGSDLTKLLSTAREVAAAGALLAFEGPNEPNNWGITYDGGGGGSNKSWVPVAEYQRDMYKAVKSDPLLKKYPVFSVSEEGAETDNVGLQFLTIPNGASTSMPEGTKYADYANVHNYIYHPNSPNVEDNKTWDAADPTSACKVDGLYGEYGVTWAHRYVGYSAKQLLTLPRVTTETGTTIGGQVTEEIHADNLLSMYLDQFKRGWSYTSVYLLRDRVDEAGNQQFGFFRPDYTPRKAAVYLHNLTTILADKGWAAEPGYLDYTIQGESPTVHDMLLRKSDGELDIVVWDEQVTGSTPVLVRLGANYATVRVYDPTIGTTPVQTYKRNGEIPLTLGNHPEIIALRRQPA